MKVFDALIIGAGHNGLVAAGYLAKAGKQVLVVERRRIPGGMLVTEALGDFQADMVGSGTLHPDVVRDLRLSLPTPTPGAHFAALQPGGAPLALGPDPAQAVESMRRVSERDAARWPGFLHFMDKATRFLASAYRTRMPRLPAASLPGGYDLAKLALDLRLAGRKGMLEIIRALPMTAQEFVEEWFESEPVRAAVASLGVHGVTLGVMSAGTAFNLMHNWLNRGGLAQRHIGQAGQVTGALVEAARGYGADLRLGAEVAQIMVESGRATGVVLSGGEQIAARRVLSSADPKRTFLSLVGPMELPPTFVWQIQSIRMRGAVAKVHLGVDSLPEGMQAHATYTLAPSLRYLERAYDAAKYGEVSGTPYLEATTTGNVISIHFQYAPFELRSGDWRTERASVETLAVEALNQHFPDLKAKVQKLESLTPQDLETTYALTEGDLNHGQLMLDQFLFMRPAPGWSDHRTPIEGLYLCGSGVHAGGGISGTSGRNAARVVLRERQGR